MAAKKLTTPLSDEVVRDLRAGDAVQISGVVYQARDAAHKRLVALLEAGQPLPFDLHGAVVYYMGPSPAQPGRVIGSAGPTTSGRMDAYAPWPMAHGLKGMIGKGLRTPEVKQAMIDHAAVYFAATGGACVLLARCIVGNEVIAYPELGAEGAAYSRWSTFRRSWSTTASAATSTRRDARATRRASSGAPVAIPLRHARAQRIQSRHGDLVVIAWVLAVGRALGLGSTGATRPGLTLAVIGCRIGPRPGAGPQPDVLVSRQLVGAHPLGRPGHSRIECRQDPQA